MTEPLDIEAIKAHFEAAMPGPWRAVKEDAGSYVLGDESGVYGRLILDNCRAYDAAFISFARQVIPALIAEVERLRAEIERLRAAMPETAHDRCDACGHPLSDDVGATRASGSRSKS